MGPFPRVQNYGHASDNSLLPLSVTTNPTTSSLCVLGLNEPTNPSLSDMLPLLHETSPLQSPASSTALDQQAPSCVFLCQSCTLSPASARPVAALLATVLGGVPSCSEQTNAPTSIQANLVTSAQQSQRSFADP
ncbi:hypothetical protein NL676_024879 [Syzygium grande]|nr:hypothetical protein NL676_024879 [Syzygium grande]